MVSSTSWCYPNCVYMKINFITITNQIIIPKKITFYLSSLSSPISIQWLNFADLKRKLRQAKSNFRKITTNEKELQTQHLLQRTSAMNIENKAANFSTIIKIQKMEQVILMWKKINYLTSDKKNSSLQTLDIPVDANTNWNEIQKNKKLTIPNHRWSWNNGTSHRRKKLSSPQSSSGNSIHYWTTSVSYMNWQLHILLPRNTQWDSWHWFIKIVTNNNKVSKEFKTK